MSDKNYILNGAVLTKAFDNGEDVFEVPNGVKTIGEGAFRETNFKRVILPKSVVKIGINAFKGCKNLEEINLKYIYEFGNGAFAQSGVRAVELHAPVIPDMLFQSCGGLSRVELFGTREIGLCAFERIAATEIELPETLVKIGNYAFLSSKLSCVYVPKKIVSIGKGAFVDCRHVFVYSKTCAENFWGTSLNIDKAFVGIVNEDDGTYEDFFFYPNIFDRIEGCFQDGKFDAAAFDKVVFHLENIRRDDVRDRMYAMMVRLPGIYKLHNSEFQAHYSAFIDYFKAHKPFSAMVMLDFDKVRFLNFLDFTVDEETFPELLDYAIKKGDTEVTAAILEYKNEHFPNAADRLALE